MVNLSKPTKDWGISPFIYIYIYRQKHRKNIFKKKRASNSQPKAYMKYTTSAKKQQTK